MRSSKITCRSSPLDVAGCPLSHLSPFQAFISAYRQRWHAARDTEGGIQAWVTAWPGPDLRHSNVERLWKPEYQWMNWLIVTHFSQAFTLRLGTEMSVRAPIFALAPPRDWHFWLWVEWFNICWMDFHEIHVTLSLSCNNSCEILFQSCHWVKLVSTPLVYDQTPAKPDCWEQSRRLSMINAIIETKIKIYLI